MDHKLGVYSTYVAGNEKAEQCLSLFGRMVGFFFASQWNILAISMLSHSFRHTHAHRKVLKVSLFALKIFPSLGKKKKAAAWKNNFLLSFHDL